uniref:Uncharacterized protein n=1 Tax=viral metagenome TaxID=1070528 RepID=A0A6C0DLW1_9ZZZZ
MATIKLTPFLIFLLLLIVLVISVIIGNKYSREGFINFHNDKNPINEVWVPQYSKTKNVTKIYDNIFYDTTNGNLIELDASGLTGGARVENNTDTSGSTINNILVTPRDAKFTFIFRTDLSNGKVISQNTDVGLKSTLDKSFKSWSYPSQCVNTDKSNTFYIPWSDSTYITTIQEAANKINGVTTLFGPGNTINNINIVDISSVSSYFEDTDGNNGKSVIDNMYDTSRNVYQLSKYVKYDTFNSNLIIQSGDNTNKKLTVYDRYKTKSEITTVPTPNTNDTKTSTIPNVGFNSWNVLDVCGQNLVIYSCVGVKTVVALATYKDNSKTKIVLRNVVRFNDKTVVVADEPAQSTPSTTPSSTTSNVPATQTTTSSPTVTVTDSSNNSSSCPISNYFNWKEKYNCNNSETEFDDKYILKSQIVPPVCPSCPACASCAGSSSQTCTNCGGSGGSGTLTTDGKSIVDNKNTTDTRTNLAGAISNIGTGSTNVAGKVVDTAGNIISNAGTGTANLLRDTGSGATGLLKDTASGATGLLKDTASGATGLLKGAASEAKGLIRDAGSGVKDILTQGSRDRDRQVGTYYGEDIRYRNNGTVPMVLGTQNQYTDQYSYYGTLPQKDGANFMPITADFSSFRH